MRRGNDTIPIRSDVEQHVAAPADGIDEVADHLLGRHEFLHFVEPPTALVEIQALFPRCVDDGTADGRSTLLHLEVTLPPGTRADHGLRLIFPDHRVEFERFPQPCGIGVAALVGKPTSVVPEDIDFAIVFHQFLDLAITLALHQRRALRQFLRLEVSRKPPIHRRIIQSDSQPGLAAGSDVFRHEIPLRCLPGTAEALVTCRAVPQRETVVMPRGQNHVIHSGALRRLRPRPWVKVLGHKLIGEPGIFLGGNILFEHGPFAGARNRIQPPVDEQAELGLPPPCHISWREFQPFVLDRISLLENHPGCLALVLFRSGLLLARAGRIGFNGAGVRLRLAGGAAAVGDILFKQCGQACHDFGMLRLHVVVLAEVAGQVVELDARQSLCLGAARFRVAPTAGIAGEDELPIPLADRERAEDRTVDDRLAQGFVRARLQRGKHVDAVLRRRIGQMFAQDRRTGGEQIRLGNDLVTGGAGLDLGRPAHDERDVVAAFPDIGFRAAEQVIRIVPLFQQSRESRRR